MMVASGVRAFSGFGLSDHASIEQLERFARLDFRLDGHKSNVLM
jgi:hypothetical protein